MRCRKVLSLTDAQWTVYSHTVSQRQGSHPNTPRAEREGAAGKPTAGRQPSRLHGPKLFYLQTTACPPCSVTTSSPLYLAASPALPKNRLSHQALLWPGFSSIRDILEHLVRQPCHMWLHLTAHAHRAFPETRSKACPFRTPAMYTGAHSCCSKGEASSTLKDIRTGGPWVCGASEVKDLKAAGTAQGQKTVGKGRGSWGCLRTHDTGWRWLGLRTLAFAKDLGLVLSIHMVTHNCLLTPPIGNHTPSSGSYSTRYTHGTQIHTQVNTHTHEIHTHNSKKKNESLNLSVGCTLEESSITLGHTELENSQGAQSPDPK